MTKVTQIMLLAIAATLTTTMTAQAFALSGSDVTLKAPGNGLLLGDHSILVYVDDISSIGTITVKGTSPTNSVTDRLVIEKDSIYIDDVSKNTNGWAANIPGANFEAGENKFELEHRGNTPTDDTRVVFSVFIAKDLSSVSILSTDSASDIKTKIAQAQSGAVVTFADGTYDNLGTIKISKPLTLKSTTGNHADSDAKFTGHTSFDIRSSDVKIAGLEFVDVTKIHVIHSYPTKDYTGIVIEKNLFDNTAKSAVVTYVHEYNTYKSSVTVAENEFVDIGFNNMTSLQKSKLTDEKVFYKNYSSMAIKLEGSEDSVIFKNVIHNGTGTGILVDNSTDVTVKDNDIRDVPTFGIAVDRSTTGIQILENRITNSTYADKFIKDSAAPADNDVAYAAIAIKKADDALVKDNVIAKAKNGILFCPGTCDKDYTPISEEDDRSYSEGPSTGIVTKNSIVEIKQKHIVNAQPGKTLYAQLNYFGDTTDPRTKIDGTVHYGPWHTDSTLDRISTSTTVQTSTFGVSTSTCSIALEKDKLEFDSRYGQRSDALTQKVTNTGPRDVSGLILDSSGWKRPGGELASTVHTDVKLTGQAASTEKQLTESKDAIFSTPITIGGEMLLDFVIDLAGERAGFGNEKLTETVTYLASCS